MKKLIKKISAFMLVTAMLFGMAGCGAQTAEGTGAAVQTAGTGTAGSGTAEESEAIAETVENKTAENKAADETAAGQEKAAGTPKYIFLFIGDGMSYPQIQSAAYYTGAVASKGGVETGRLSFMDFPIAGSAQTYDSTSFCPDSASTATSIATGNKTYSGTINMDTTMTTAFETIAEKLKKQKDYKIGILSTVNLNHATPAAFYAHQESRNSYYEIAEELVASNFDYFAGGALKKPTGDDKDKQDIYEIAAESGYKVIKTQAEAEAASAADGKLLIVSETLADSDAMNYELDTADTEWKLADYVEKGIEVLDNETGFFMMIEGGKIDWACHANDAGSTVTDTLALDAAVKKAVEFYNAHPDETLILVTGDHETGGLTIGFAGTDYDTYMTNLSNQTISYAKFDTDYVAGYKENKTPFEEVLKDIKACFGLMTAEDAEATEDSRLVLTDYEYSLLEKAYERTLEVGMSDKDNMTQEEYVLYGTYEPLSVTVTHILNNKSGISFSSYAHTGLPVPVFAIGSGQELFEGYYDNTDIYFNLAKLTGVQ